MRDNLIASASAGCAGATGVACFFADSSQRAGVYAFCAYVGVAYWTAFADGTSGKAEHASEGIDSLADAVHSMGNLALSSFVTADGEDSMRKELLGASGCMIMAESGIAESVIGGVGEPDVGGVDIDFGSVSFFF